MVCIIQTDWPSTLLSLVVVKGEVRVIPVITVEKDCQRTFHGFWKNPILLKEGDAGRSIYSILPQHNDVYIHIIIIACINYTVLMHPSN